MGEYVYTTVPGKIKALLEKIRVVGIPPKVTQQWLKTVGFTSSNDPSLIGVLKQVGFIDASGVPTPTWSHYRGAKHKAVLAEAIRKGYADLFAVYGDANQRPNAELDHVFSTSSSAGKQVVAKTVGTFKGLADEADFAASTEPKDLTMEASTLHSPATKHPPSPPTDPVSMPPTVHIDLQIHISPEASVDQIDQVFASMAKHLYGNHKGT